MFKEGCIVPFLFVVLGFGWLILRDIAKDETTVFVNFSKYPDQTFSLSELSLEKYRIGKQNRTSRIRR